MVFSNRQPVISRHSVRQSIGRHHIFFCLSIIQLVSQLVHRPLCPSFHSSVSQSASQSIIHFTITAEIHARSLANFYCQYADGHMNLKFMRRQRARAGNSTICYRKKQIDVSF